MHVTHCDVAEIVYDGYKESLNSSQDLLTSSVVRIRLLAAHPENFKDEIVVADLSSL